MEKSWKELVEAFPRAATAWPPCTFNLPGTGGVIGPEPDDFLVDEVPLYAASGAGEHLYVRIEKRSMTTRDAVRDIARASGVPEREIGTAGMKDKHAVTRQWLSLPERRAKPVDQWALPDGLSVLETARHGNKLRTGHLRGNRFTIRIAGVHADADARARAFVDELRARGLPNYFGVQRFGRDADNVPTALEWLSAERSGKKGAPFHRKFFPSVLQSEVFNRYVMLRLAAGVDAPLPGEVVRLNGTGSLFAVEDVSRELPRWTARDIHPTGVMVGPKAKKAGGLGLELEEAALGSMGLDSETLTELARFADGTRRDVLVWPEEVEATLVEPSSLQIRFFLPSGSYATEVVRELTHPVE